MSAEEPYKRVELGTGVRDYDVVNAIHELSVAKGYPPTTREIGEAVGLSSSSSVHVRLGVLRKAGFVDWVNKSPRTIKILRWPEEPSG